MARNPNYQDALKELWKHGVACAHASYLIAQLEKLSRPSEVFFMGLMHDIGKLYLFSALTDRYISFCQEAAEAGIALDVRERRVFGRQGAP